MGISNYIGDLFSTKPTDELVDYYQQYGLPVSSWNGLDSDSEYADANAVPPVEDISGQHGLTASEPSDAFYAYGAMDHFYDKAEEPTMSQDMGWDMHSDHYPGADFGW